MTETAPLTTAVDEDLLCHLTRVVYSDLGFCGCGWPTEGLTVVHELLAAFGADPWERRSEALLRLLPKDGVRHIVLSVLDHAGLMDHGSSVVGAWLTPRGRWWLYAVETVGGISGLSGRFDEPGIGYPHTGEAADAGQECTDACWVVPDGWEPAGAAVPVVVPPVVVPAAPGPCVRCLYGTPHEQHD
ncbi:MAG TPA: hypothetical protein VGN19_03090 [Pedococcus sp.]|nr:hypothetical protein [Pedococcus sp.]